MKNNKIWMVVLSGLIAIIFVACSGNTPATDSQTEDQAPEPTEEQEAEPTEAPATESPATEMPESSDEGELVTLYVGPEQVDCEGEGPQTCLLVKENPEDEYQFFYSSIDGFNYEPGYEYELNVLVEPVENPPAGGSSLNYTLVEEVSKTAVSTEPSGVAGADTSNPLDGTLWTLDSYLNEAGETVSLFPETEITLGFEAAEFNGNASCNQYFGSYELNGDNITFGPMGMTEMFCLPEELMAQETAYAANLGLVRTYSQGQNELILADENGNPLLTYSTKVPTSLTNTLWQVIGYNNGSGGVVSVLQDTEMTAVFAEDGTLAGSSGCNNYTTTYEAEDPNISISEQMAVTRRACANEEQAEQEQQYLAALPLAATYTVTGDRLEIRDENGSLLADYTAVQPLALTDVTWVATGVNNGSGGVSSISEGTRLTAQFSNDNIISGSAGCNSYNGAYETNGDEINIGPLGSTLMACAEDVMTQETQYLAALQSAATYQIAGNTLELRTEDGALAASFIAEEPSDLAGSQWDVLSYNNGNEAVVSVSNGTELTADFSEDGNLAGFAGCNNYSASYEAAGESITIGPVISTQMACAEDVLTQETQYLAALETAATYRIDGHLMEMRTAEGSLVATFQQAGYVDPEIIRLLEQATYQLDMAESGEVTLENGEYSEPIAEGSASELHVTLTDQIATGTLNDEFAVTAVIAANSGGSGTFLYLSVFTLDDNGFENTAVTLLGDRVQVNSVDITNNTIVVDMTNHSEDDALCCPTQHVINTYELVGNELNLLDSQLVEE